MYTLLLTHTKIKKMQFQRRKDVGGVAVVTHRLHGSRKFCQRGSNSDSFSVDKGVTEDPYDTKSGPSSPHQRNAFKWRFASGPMIARH